MQQNPALCTLHPAPCTLNPAPSAPQGQKFRACDRQWRKYLKLAFDNPQCLEFCDTPDLLAM